MSKKFVFVIEYFHKTKDSFVTQKIIPNCTMEKIKVLLFEVFGKEEPIGVTEDGEMFLVGGYKITPLIKEKIYNMFDIDVDIDNYTCFLANAYLSDFDEDGNMANNNI